MDRARILNESPKPVRRYLPMTIKLLQGDCLELMPGIESGSVDLILADPPYGIIKGAPQKWGREGTGIDVRGFEWDKIIDYKNMLFECNRILRKNGSLLIFSQEPYTSKLILQSHNNMPFSYRLTWVKDNFANSLLANKAPVSYVEDICVFFKNHTKHDFEYQHPMREYAGKVFEYIDISLNDIFRKMGNFKADHFLRSHAIQFKLCTAATYKDLIDIYSIDKMLGFREYDDLKRQDKEFIDDLILKLTLQYPKTFNVPPGKKFKSNVLQFPKDYPSVHPTQKPVDLMADLILTYTNEGDTVLDFCMGSGTVGVASQNLGRSFIGIELDEKYFKIAQHRIAGGVKMWDQL